MKNKPSHPKKTIKESYEPKKSYTPNKSTSKPKEIVKPPKGGTGEIKPKK